MDKVRIGVVGLGFGQHHVRTLANMAEAQLVAVADRHPNVPGGLDGYARQYGAKAYRDGIEMIEHETLDKVALAEGFHIHAGLAPLGAGMTDWSQMLRLMAPHLPDDSWVILEHVQTPDEARSSLELLRAAAVEAGVTLD